MRWLKAPRTPGRAAGALGALALVLSLWLTWFYDRSVVPNVPLDAWENYARTDVVLAALALAGLVGAMVSPARRSILLRALCGTAAVAVVAHAFSVSDPGRGARVALLAAVLLAVSPAIDPVGTALRRRIGAADGDGERAWRALELGLAGAGTLWRVLTLTPVLAIPLTLIALPLLPTAPGGGTDGSWITALHVSADRGIPFGHDLIYTYGPLGYLTVPRLYYADLFREGVLYVALAYYAMAVTFLAAARRSFPVVVAAIVTVALLQAFRITSPDEQTQFAVAAMAFAWAVMLLRRGAPASRGWTIALLVLLAVFAAVESLIKLNAGLTVAVAVGLGSIGLVRRPWAGLLAYAGAFVVALVAVWLVIGEPLGALGAYLKGSYQVVAGFSDAMYTEEGGREWEYLAVPLIAIVLGFTAWRATEDLPWARRAAILVLTAVVGFSAFKQGFARHDGHSATFFASAIAMAVALGWPRIPRATGYIAVAGLLIAFFAATKTAPFSYTQPGNTVSLWHDIYDLARHPQPTLATMHRDVRKAEGVPPEALRLVGDHTFHAYPSEAALAWAYPELRWDPLPVFQGYVAYTPYLDELNADKLRAADAPERLLRTNEYSPFEEPATNLELACRYRELDAGEKWQVLARTPSRCGAPRLLAKVPTQTGQTITVPEGRPNELVYMRVSGYGVGAREKLRSLLWKPHDRSVSIDGSSGARIRLRLLDQPAILRVPRRYDFSGPYKLDYVKRTLRFQLGGEALGPSAPKSDPVPVTASFYAVPLRASGR